MKYYIVAGELSGDKHAALLAHYIKEHDNGAVLRGFGGDGLKSEGMTIVKHIDELAFMGFMEVAAHLKEVLHNISLCKKDIVEFNPDCVIFVDYPGFNLRIAKFAHKQGFKTFYYISPQVWAWKKGRIKTIKRVITKLYVILPFEKNFYKRHDVEVEYFGNPLLDEITMFRSNKKNRQDFIDELGLDNRPIVAILPGSRGQEISKMLPLQMMVAKKYKNFNFLVACVNAFDEWYYRKYVHTDNVRLIYNHTYDILNISRLALVTSGTATLETALFNVPQVVCYITSKISYLIGRYVAKVKFISLVNLILNRKAVTELIQQDFSTDKLDNEFRKIAFDEEYRHKILADYDVLKKMLGSSGASNNIAQSIVSKIKLKYSR